MEEDENVGDKNGFFKTYHLKVLESLKNTDLEQLKSCSNDEQRFAFCHSLPYVHQHQPKVLRRLFKPKSSIHAGQRRIEGNKAFLIKNYLQALQLYSSAILKASLYEGVGEPELAYAFANRSAVLLHLGKYEECLIDIKQALINGYPKESHYKLEERKAKCYLGLEKASKAVAACQSAIQLVTQCQLDPIKESRINRDIQKLLDEANQKTLAETNELVHAEAIVHAAVSATSDKKYPEVVGGKHAELQAASNRVKIEKSNEYGRYAIAALPLSVGDVIVVEKPCASVMQPEKYSTHCHHCFKRMNIPMPCPTCSRIGFCSLACRSQALETYHAYECSIIDFLFEAGISITCYLAFRMITLKKSGFFTRLRPFIEGGSVMKQEVEVDEEMKKYIATYSLVNHAERRSVTGFFHITLMANFLFKCLKLVNYFGPNSSENIDFSGDLSEQESWIGALLLKQLQLVQFNAHEVSDLHMERSDSIEDAKSVFLGAAVYPTVALFNHSCEPGIVRYCIGDMLIVRAIKSIAKGEMIAENYGPIYSQKTREYRQRVLKERYWFDCNCKPCRENWPLFGDMNMDVFKFRCTTSSCGNALVVHSDTLTPFITCQSCKKSSNILKSLTYLQETEDSVNRGRMLLDQGQFSTALGVYAESLSKLDTILCPPYRDYIMCQESARKCMLTMGNVQITG